LPGATANGHVGSPKPEPRSKPVLRLAGELSKKRDISRNFIEKREIS